MFTQNIKIVLLTTKEQFKSYSNKKNLDKKFRLWKNIYKFIILIY